MKLENQVCSLELSKQLEKLGVKQESLFEWTIEYRKKDGESSIQLMGGYFGIDVRHSISWRVYDFKKRETFSAFTVAELGEMLPYQVNGGIISFHKFPKGYTIQYNPVARRVIKEGKYWVDAKTEANARAKMLICLLENKLINLPK